MPYKGSKNTIAMDIVNMLPPGDVLVDTFAGGCAITHAALLSGKWKRIICNDIIPGQTETFLNAVNGMYANETRWISREDFFRLKDQDPYVRMCWSFGNDLRSYLYGVDV